MIKPYKFTHHGIELAGILTLPSGASTGEDKSFPLVIFSHGLLSSKESEKFLAFAPRFAQAGIATFRFDYLGCGESGGKPENTTITILHQELKAALQFVKSLPYHFTSTGLLGSSIGGFISLWEAAENPAIAALVTLAAPAVLDFSEPEKNETLKILKLAFFEDAEKYDLLKRLPQVSRVLILQGDRDEVVPEQNAYQIFEKVKPPKQLEIIKGGDHRLNEPEVINKCCILSLQWFKQAFSL
jgi:pimeloyl-ACP methyl ester carboxylesterase